VNEAYNKSQSFPSEMVLMGLVWAPVATEPIFCESSMDDKNTHFKRTRNLEVI
jgi:hypothetical protein